MRRIGHVQETPGDVEVCVVKLTAAEHADLHQRREKFVNEKPIFPGKVVKNIEFSPEALQTSAAAAPGETWMSVIIHLPACTCRATCTPLPG